MPSFFTPLVYYLATVSFTPTIHPFVQPHNFVIIPKTLGSPTPPEGPCSDTSLARKTHSPKPTPPAPASLPAGLAEAPPNYHRPRHAT